MIDEDGDFDGGGRAAGRSSDEAVQRAVRVLRGFFARNRQRVYYSRQLEILNERQFFHWVTNAAIRQLVAEGEIKADAGKAEELRALFHRSHRYPRRQIARLRALVAEYSNAEKNHGIGEYCEDLVERAFFRSGFRFVGQKVRILDGREWTKSNHDLDFVFERDGLRYGIEVKNTLGYSNLGEEVQPKIELALHLGCQPLFVARMLPKAWNHAIIEAKGRVLLFGWQLHPKTNQGIVLRMHEELGLPVKVARDLPEGDMQRFLAAHQKLLAELGDRET